MATGTQKSSADGRTEEIYSFEEAMTASGYGMFNILLLLASLPGLWGTVFEITTMSYVLPAAECDLHLNLVDKGAVNAVTFAGMIISAFLWGTIADSFGRKYTLAIALLVEGTLTLLSILSTSTKHLMAFKFVAGFISCGPIAIFLTYICEFHGKKHRLYSIVSVGLINSLPLGVLPLLAYAILPNEFELNIGVLKINSWRIFIVITAIPFVISGILIMFFPESPKFLMSEGRSESAIKSFRTIYSVNKFREKDTYPVRKLHDETSERPMLKNGSASKLKRSKQLWLNVRKTFQHLRFLSKKENVRPTVLASFMFFFLFMSVNAVRLWRPGYFADLREWENKTHFKFTTCTILQFAVNNTRQTLAGADPQGEICKPNIRPTAYIDSVAIGSPVFVLYLLTVLFVKYTTNNILLIVYVGVCAATLITEFFATSRLMVMILSAIYTAFGLVSTTLLINVSLNIYPTSIRTMALVLLMTIGRLGSIVGNLALPFLTHLHCVALFVFFGATIVCTFVLAFFLPNTAEASLK